MSSDPDSPPKQIFEDPIDDHVMAFCTALQFHLSEPTASAFQLRLQAVNDPQTSKHVLDHIASHGAHHLVKRVADHPATAEETLSRLVYHNHPDVRAALAGNKNLPLEMQLVLAKDEHPDVRFSLAESYEIDPAVLAALIEDDNPFVADRARTTLQRLQSGAAYMMRLPFKVADRPTIKRKRASG